MKLLSFLIVFGVFLFVRVNSGSNFDIDGYTYFVSHPMKKNWYQALRYCLYQGLTLVAIDNQEENNRILTAAQRTNLTVQQMPAFWTSGTDLGDKDHYYWASTGHAVLYTDYSPGQPDFAFGNEHCLEIRLAVDRKWNDVNCDTSSYFICRGTNINARFGMTT